jgi:hypothetical protein
MRNPGSRRPARRRSDDSAAVAQTRKERDVRRVVSGFFLGYRTIDFLRAVRQERRPASEVPVDVGEMRWVAIKPDWSVPHPKALSPEQTAQLLASDTYRDALTGLAQSYRDQPIRRSWPAG